MARAKRPSQAKRVKHGYGAKRRELSLQYAPNDRSVVGDKAAPLQARRDIGAHCFKARRVGYIAVRNSVNSRHERNDLLIRLHEPRARCSRDTGVDRYYCKLDEVRRLMPIALNIH